MKNLNPLEKDIEKRVCDYAKSLKMLVYKFTSPSRRSVPDRMFITPKGVVFFIEFKRKGQKPTAAQEVEITKILATGVRVYLVDNVDRGKQVVSNEFYGFIGEKFKEAIRTAGVEIANKLEEIRRRKSSDPLAEY